MFVLLRPWKCLFASLPWLRSPPVEEQHPRQPGRDSVDGGGVRQSGHRGQDQIGDSYQQEANWERDQW